MHVTPSAHRTTERSPGWWRTYGWMYAVVALLHIAGWGTLVVFLAPEGILGIGLGLTAYTLGLRHAFDADHIAAIDNTTRKLQEERRRPTSVGFWFALGHSTVVVVMVALVAFGMHAFAGEITQESALTRSAGLFGASISGVFLLIIGALNLVILVDLLGVFRRMRRGRFDEAELEAQLAKRGLMNRFFGRLMRFVRRPLHIYPIGVLFGFGFDTVTEVALLALAGTAAAGNLPWYAILVLPILFTAGMSLMDTTDGAFMNSAYGWAFARPARKVFYNLTVTAISVIVALGIGLLQVVGVIAQGAGITGGALGFVAGIGLNYVGYGVVALFLLAWIVAMAIWRFGRIEDRWNAALVTGGGAQAGSARRGGPVGRHSDHE